MSVDNCYPKLNRLLTKSDFLNLKSESRRFVFNPIIFYFKKSKGSPTPSRIGISISKKIGNSVQRNKLKRIIREIFRKSNFKNSSTDILVTLSPRNYSRANKDNFNSLVNFINTNLDNCFKKIF